MGASVEGIDTSKKEWERQLTLEKIKNSLKQRDANEKLKNMPDDKYDELRSITSAMNPWQQSKPVQITGSIDIRSNTACRSRWIMRSCTQHLNVGLSL